MNQIELKALAKINLGLDVLGRRENGYHDVRMVMQTIYLYDEVKLTKKKEPGIELTTNLGFLPTGDTNIAYKAAKLLIEEFGISEGVKIVLNKHIPVAAGLAGGSSDAAAVLFGMNRMFGLHLQQKDLMERGVKLGADVPYCIMRGTVLAEGIGEELSVLPAMPKCTVFSIQNKSGVGTEYGMQIQALMGCRGAYGSCWNNTVPSTQLVDMYEFKDGRPFNWDEIFPGYNAMTPEQRKELLSVEMDGSGTIVGLREADTAKILSAYTCRDPRLMATVIVPYSHYMGNIGRTTNVDLIFALDHNLAGNANGGTIQNNAGWVSYLYRKFVTEGDQGGAISNRLHTPFAFPLIRFADVLLMLSEAYNEAGQLDKAVTEFNKVRARVGMPGLNSGPAWMVVSNKEQMAERIRKERAVEFAGEGLRFSDLRRWGYEIAHKTLNNVDAVNIYGEPIYTHLFTERDMLWPIPGVERERNKELTQNPGW